MKPPKKLNKDGIRYWDIYIEYLNNPNNIQLEVLGDLCYWEQKKEAAISDLEKIGRDFIAYLDGEKKPKHTQPVAPMINLKSAQDKVASLRESLFDEDLLKGTIENNSNLRSVKNF